MHSLALCAPPDPAWKDQQGAFRYNLGLRHGYDMDEDYLLITFDAKGTTTERCMEN